MKRAISGVVLMILVPVVAPMADEDDELIRCQALKDRIERYTVLRRKGGSTSKMEAWRDQLRSAEAEFREIGCRVYRRELK